MNHIYILEVLPPPDFLTVKGCAIYVEIPLTTYSYFPVVAKSLGFMFIFININFGCVKISTAMNNIYILEMPPPSIL